MAIYRQRVCRSLKVYYASILHPIRAVDEAWLATLRLASWRYENKRVSDGAFKTHYLSLCI